MGGGGEIEKGGGGGRNQAFNNNAVPSKPSHGRLSARYLVSDFSPSEISSIRF